MPTAPLGRTAQFETTTSASLCTLLMFFFFFFLKVCEKERKKKKYFVLFVSLCAPVCVTYRGTLGGYRSAKSPDGRVEPVKGVARLAPLRICAAEARSKYEIRRVPLPADGEKF